MHNFPTRNGHSLHGVQSVQKGLEWTGMYEDRWSYDFELPRQEQPAMARTRASLVEKWERKRMSRGTFPATMKIWKQSLRSNVHGGTECHSEPPQRMLRRLKKFHNDGIDSRLWNLGPDTLNEFAFILEASDWRKLHSGSVRTEEVSSLKRHLGTEVRHCYEEKLTAWAGLGRVWLGTRTRKSPRVASASGGVIIFVSLSRLRFPK